MEAYMAQYPPTFRMVADRDAKREMTWWESDARYIAGGSAMVAKYNPDWDDELEEMNRGTVGRGSNPA